MDYGYLLPLLLLLVAMLYSSVGHGGASGYLAIMALYGVAAGTTRPTALLLNLAVSSIAAFQYLRRGHFAAGQFASFAIASIPLAYLGGASHLSADTYRIILGVALLAAATRLAFDFSDPEELVSPSVPVCLAVGGIIGFVSGVVGVGGGIFLTPVLLLMKWADAKTAAGISAMFIFVNSAAALLGMRDSFASFGGESFIWLGSAVVGGIAGSYIGAAHLNYLVLRRILAVVLVLAAVKLLFT
jgi:hypothetical protein